MPVAVGSVRQRGEPVFVDGTGRRRRLATMAGIALGTGLLASLGLIVAGLFGVTPSSLPGLPDHGGLHAQPVPAPPSAAATASGRHPTASHSVSAGTSGGPVPAPAPAPSTASPSPTGKHTGPPPGHGRPSRT